MRERGGSLTPQSAYALTLLATGDEEAACKAWEKRVDEITEQKEREEEANG